jgi:hypothetical protein
LLHLFSGDPITILRATGQQVRNIENGRLTCVLMVQTDAGTKFLKAPENSSSGLLSRFIMLAFDEKPPIPQPMSNSLRERWNRLLGNIYRRRFPASEPVKLMFDEPAKRLFEQTRDAYRQQADEGEGCLTATLLRAGEQIGRLALVRALMRLGLIGRIDEMKRPTVTLEDVEAATTIFRIALRDMRGAVEETLDSDGLRLLECLKAMEGPLPLKDAKEHGFTERMLKEIVGGRPDLLEIARWKRKGKRGQPPLAVFLKNQQPS